jgi:diketogulonate reductase-like aldo/keto reductase
MKNLKLISKIGQGISGVGREENQNKKIIKERIEAIRYGVKKGINFIDTALIYGNGFSEKIISVATKDIRELCFIASKFYPSSTNTKNALRNNLYRTLENLKTDYLDLYQLHWPNPNVDYDIVSEELNYFIKTGLIKNVGTSNFNVQSIKSLNKKLIKNILSNQSEMNLSNLENYNFFYKKNKTYLIAYSPLNQGRFTDNNDQLKYLHELSQKKKTNISAIIINWLLKFENVLPVIKMKNKKQIDNVLESLNINLDKNEINEINKFYKAPSTYLRKNKIIFPKVFGKQKPYKKLNEALINKLDLIPSPIEVSQLYKKKLITMRIKVTKSKKGYYVLHSYDLWGEMKKYWAWILAFPKKLIPVTIIRRK